MHRIQSPLQGLSRAGRRWVWFAVALLLFATAVNTINTILAWRLQEALHQSLATSDVHVRLDGWPTALVGGQFARVSVIAHRATANGLVVDEFAAELWGVSLDPVPALLQGQFAVRAVEGGRVTVRILQEDVQRALAERPYITGPTVRFASGTVQIAGMITAVGVRVQAELRGRLDVEEARRVVLHVDQMQIHGLSLPGGVANLLIAPLNPLLSVETLPIPLKLTSVDVSDGRAIIAAEPR